MRKDESIFELYYEDLKSIYSIPSFVGCAISLIVVRILIKEPLEIDLEFLFAVAYSDESVFSCEGALREGQKTVNETGIHGDCIVEPLLLAAKIVPYHDSLVYILDS